MGQKKTSITSEPIAKRPYLKQVDVPSASLEEALRVPQTILDHYAGKPTAPLSVAKALNVDPKGSQIRVLTGALRGRRQTRCEAWPASSEGRTTDGGLFRNGFVFSSQMRATNTTKFANNAPSLLSRLE